MYDYCFDCMMSICRRYEKDDDSAMDILNQAFIKVLKNLGGYESKYPLKPWLRKITLNVAIDKYRQKVRKREVFEDWDDETPYEDTNQGTLHGLEWVESDYLQHLLSSLKDAERTVFNLFAVDGFSHKEIGEMMEITERSSIRHLTNARRKLQEHLKSSEKGMKKA